MSDVVVVESPAKAKTINKYLGGGYTVIASLGHVRDLVQKDGSVDPDADFAMKWDADGRGQKQVSEIARALKGAKTLYLATDPDREGEAISWHVRDMLAARGALKGKDVQRIAFNEITRSAVRHAIANPRALNTPLIEAYLARRALDYLVGFTLSPVLWRKLPGSRSAGRVQSVALRLICEREAEIEVFRPREYWTVAAAMLTPDGAAFSARLTHLDGKRLDQFDLPTEADARRAEAAVRAARLRVASVEKKRVRRNPPPPFTTSTLQQEASRKLGFGAQKTMRTAQGLYEGIELDGESVGLITYMRTDGVQMAREAITAIRGHIGTAYGDRYRPDAPREYSSKAKNVEEAHEAIRPTDVERTPDAVGRFLTDDQRRLYELVWKRAVASQMASAELDQTTVELRDGGTVLRATGTVIAFDGFLRLYREGLDDAEDDEARVLPPMAEGQRPTTREVTAEQHFTQPPPRYSEASLVKKLEELGIGRPSTYASILTVLQERTYVRLENRRFIPEDRGRLVTAFLTGFFTRYVDTGFTASLEEQLDQISAGDADWRAVLRAFWTDFSAAVGETKDLTISDVIDALDRDLGPHFFPDRADGSSARACPTCGDGRLGLRLGRTGAFIGCSNYPECRFTRPLAVDDGEGGGAADRSLGPHPETGEEVFLKRGPYGLYVQLGETPAEAKVKPKRASLPAGVAPDGVMLDQAVGWLSLPRLVGTHPERQEPIYAGLGRFGPYLKMGNIFANLPKDEDVLTIGHNRALDLIARKLEGLRELGPHPKGGLPVMVKRGRFGFYVQHDGTIANLPREVDKDAIDLGQAVALLAEKGKPLGKGGRKAPARKAKAAVPVAAAAKARAKPAAEVKPKAKRVTKAKPVAKAKPRPAVKAKPKAKATAKPPARATARRAAG